MADFTVGPTLFPVGTTVGVYDRRILIREQGGPVGGQVTSGVVGSDQRVTFSGLAYSADFWAAASVGGAWQKVAFSTGADPSTAGATLADVALKQDAATAATDAELAIERARVLALESGRAVKPAPAAGEVFVDPVSGSDANDGLSWGTAKATIAAAEAVLPARGGTRQLSAGIHDLAASYVTTKPGRIIGRGTATTSNAPTLLRFPSGVDGVRLAATDGFLELSHLTILSEAARTGVATITSGSAVLTSVTSAGTIVGDFIKGPGIPAGATVTNLAPFTISAAATATMAAAPIITSHATTGRGLVVAGHGAKASDVTVLGFGSHGVHVDTDAGGNANCFSLRRMRCDFNFGDGYKYSGTDSHEGLTQLCQATANGGWGFNNDGNGNVFESALGENNQAGVAKDTSLSSQWSIYVEPAPFVGVNADFSAAVDGLVILRGSGWGAATLTPAPHYSCSVVRGSTFDRFIALANVTDGGMQRTWKLSAGAYNPGWFSVTNDVEGLNILNVDANPSTRTEFNLPISFVPRTAASTANSRLFVDSADNKLKWKDSGGVVNLLY